MKGSGNLPKAIRLVGPMPPFEETVRYVLARMIAAHHIPPAWGGVAKPAPFLAPAA